MGRGEWAALAIHNMSDMTLKFSNLHTEWGRLYRFPDQDDEITVGEVIQVTIPPRGKYIFASRGQSDVTSGCEGSFDLVTTSDDTVVANIYYNCPWGNHRNVFKVEAANDQWLASVSGFDSDPNSPRIGEVAVRIARMP